MLHKTRAIVLYNLDYNDAYSIIYTYTEEFGPVSYLTSRSKGRKARIPSSLFFPLSVLELEVEHQNLRDIQRLKEAKHHLFFLSLMSNPVKSTINLFLAEFISKVIKESHPNKLLFDYILQSLRILDMMDENYANFHLVFMIRISQFLGFYPDSREYRRGMFFDMEGGCFVRYKPMHTHFLNPDESQVFSSLLRMNYENMSSFRFSRHERKDIIYRILEYYRLHLVNFPDMKSLEILHEVFG